MKKITTEVSGKAKAAISEKMVRHISLSHLLFTVAMRFIDDIDIYLSRNDMKHRTVKYTSNSLERAFTQWCRCVSELGATEATYKDLANDANFLESLMLCFAGLEPLQIETRQKYLDEASKLKFAAVPMTEDERHYYDFEKGVRFCESTYRMKVARIAEGIGQRSDRAADLLDEALKKIKSKDASEKVAEVAGFLRELKGAIILNNDNDNNKEG